MGFFKPVIWMLFILLFCVTKSEALTITVTGTTNAEREASLRAAFVQAKSATEEVLIDFDLGNDSVIEMGSMIDVVGDIQKITLDGITNKGTTNEGRIVLAKGDVWTGYSQFFRVRSSNITFKNLEFSGGEALSTGVQSLGEHFTVSHCVFHDFTSYAMTFGVAALYGMVEYTEIYDCVTGMSVASNFTLGNKNVIIGKGEGGAGISINTNRTNIKLGLGTNDYENYSFIGGVGRAISASSPFELSDMVIGGRADFLSKEACDLTTLPVYHEITSEAIFVFTESLENIVIGKEGSNPSVIISRVAGGMGVQVSRAEGLELNNTYIGVSPFWCNGERPVDEPIMSMALYTFSGVEIGVKQGNVIGATSHTVMRLFGSAVSKVHNNYFGLDSEGHSYAGNQGLNIMNASSVEIKNNKIGNFSQTAVGVRDCEKLTFENNYIGISDHAEVVHPTRSGLSVLAVKDVEISNNHFSCYLQDIYLRSTINANISSNSFDAYFNGNPLPDNIDKYCVYMYGYNVEVNILGNQFIGGNKHGLKCTGVGTAFTDLNGVDRDITILNLKSNIFKKSLTAGCSLSYALDAQIGEEDDPNSGNVFLNGIVGVDYYSNAHQGKLNVHHNYIGTSPSGEQGSLTMGVRLNKGLAGYNHSITNNTITNCTGQGISIISTEQVEMSKNLITNSGEFIKLSNSNLIDGSVISNSTITGTQQDAYNYVLSGNSYPEATVEIFRQGIGELGTSKYINSVETDVNGDWTYTDNLLGHIGSDGYLVTVTKNSITSEIQGPFDLCIKEEADATTCILVKDLTSYISVKHGKENSRLFKASDKRIGVMVDRSLYSDHPTYRLKDNQGNLLLGSTLFEFNQGLLLLDVSSVGLGGTEEYLIFELEDNQGVVTTYNFSI